MRHVSRLRATACRFSFFCLYSHRRFFADPIKREPRPRLLIRDGNYPCGDLKAIGDLDLCVMGTLRPDWFTGGAKENPEDKRASTQKAAGRSPPATRRRRAEATVGLRITRRRAKTRNTFGEPGGASRWWSAVQQITRCLLRHLPSPPLLVQ